MNKTLTAFIKKANNIHCDKYTYDRVQFADYKDEITVRCLHHGHFTTTPYNHIYNKSQCPGCVKDRRSAKNKHVFLVNAKEKHGLQYDYSQVEYVNAHTDIAIVCPKHGVFYQLPLVHTSGSGCRECYFVKQKQDSESMFFLRANEVHSNKYDYSFVRYKHSQRKIKILCPKHGVFRQSPSVHLAGSGCPGCGRNYSAVALRWLQYVEQETNSNIQHAENGGEYRLPNTNYKVDGFCHETNTVYEFHGDIYHGNLELYSRDHRCNPFSRLTAGELNQQTLDRENKIKQLGYNLVVMWENTFLELERGKIPR